MGQHQRAFLRQYEIVIAISVVLLLFFSIGNYYVLAQSGCTGDPCVFNTPTPTTTPSPLTPTVTPTGTLTPVPTSVPMPSAESFPQPNYQAPTSIPALSMPTVSLSQPTQVPLNTISTTLTISTSTMLTIDTSIAITESAGYTTAMTIIEGGNVIISGVVSYTDYISGQLTAVQGTESLSITAPPDWYAPYMPRDMAAIGWTFENVDSDTAHNYSLATWSYLFGYMVSLPIRLLRSLWFFFLYLGPVGLFLIWLIVIMLPAALGFRILLFIKEVIVRVFNFIIDVISFLLSLIGFVVKLL